MSQRRKPIAERYQMAIASAIFITGLVATIWAINHWYPVNPNDGWVPRATARGVQ